MSSKASGPELKVEPGIEDSLPTKMEVIEESQTGLDEGRFVVEEEVGGGHEGEVHGEEIITTQEITIERLERSQSPDEILPDVKVKATAAPAAMAAMSTVVPPLRPLTIAPKPAPKVPITVKPVAGQQLLFVQGGGTSQAIKLVSPQGQELNLGNLAITRPITLKQTIKPANQPTIAAATAASTGISVVQQKPIVMKKIISSSAATGSKTIQKANLITNKQGQQFMVVQKSEAAAAPPQIKLVGAANVLPSPTKTITLQQAQEMGLLGNAKIIQQAGTQKLIATQTVATSSAQKVAIPMRPTASAVSSAAKQVAFNKQGHIMVVKSADQPPQQQQIKLVTTAGPPAAPAGVSTPKTITIQQAHEMGLLGNAKLVPQAQSTPKLVTKSQQKTIKLVPQMQYIKFVTTSGGEQSATVVSGSNVLSEVKTKPTVAISNISPKVMKTVAKQVTVSGAGAQMLMLPSTFTISSHQQSAKVPIPSIRHSSTPKTAASLPPELNSPPSGGSGGGGVSEGASTVEANGIRPRKPCNCTKSQCLKLYCDCFANGEFCYLCNCMNCYNNLENEDQRNRAIKACLERNPNAFRPKIGKAKDLIGDINIRKHTKGCNCKRSGCLKNYCECYEAKIACSSNCKCIGCRNIEVTNIEKKVLRAGMDNGLTTAQILSKHAKKDAEAAMAQKRAANYKHPINFLTYDVIEATCQCLLTLAHAGQAEMEEEEETQRLIIEEFGRCLTEIIGTSTKNTR